MMLAPTVDISSAFGDNLPPVVHRRNSSNPDRASIASLSSVITPSPQPDETFFILRRSDRQKEDASSRQASPAPGKWYTQKKSLHLAHRYSLI